MKKIFRVFLILIFFTNNVKSQNAELQNLLDFADNRFWNAKLFKRLNNKIGNNKTFHDLKGLRGVDIDSVFNFYSDSTRIYGSLTNEDRFQSVHSFSINHETFSYLKSTFTRDSMLSIEYTFISSSIHEKFLFKDSKLIFYNQDVESEEFDIRVMANDTLNKRVSNFLIEVKIDPLNHKTVWVRPKIRSMNNFVLSIDPKFNSFAHTFFLANDDKQSKGLAISIGFTNGKVVSINNYIYVPYPIKEFKVFDSWIDSEFEALFVYNKRTKVNYVSDNFMIPYGKQVFLAYLRDDYFVEFIPYYLYDFSQIGSFPFKF